MAKKSTNTPATGPPPEAAYFLSLTLQNVRCFGDEQTLDLSDRHQRPARWTIILGNNGTGKTTLLQSLAGFETTPVPSQGGLLPTRLPRFAVIRDPVTHAQAWRRGELPFHFTANIALGPHLTSQDGHFEQIPVTYRVKGGGGSFAPIVPAPLTCYGYGAGRRLGSSALTQGERDNPFEAVFGGTVESLFSDKADLINAEEWLLRLDYSASKASPIQAGQQRRLEEIKRVLLNLLPEVEEIRFTNPATTNPTPQAEFKTPYGWVPLRHLGYGYQTMIAWVTDLAARLVERHPDSPDPLAEPAVVLVDEIDLHLHPRWQRQVMTFLSERFPNAQFIATAHSPLIAQAAGDANLAVLRREGDHVVIRNDVDSIRGWRIDQILTSDLFEVKSARPPYLDKLLEERREILVKPSLTEADEQRLKELEEQIGDLPTGETAEDVRTSQLLRSALSVLEKTPQTRPGP
jgi:hypothetical protein